MKFLFYLILSCLLISPAIAVDTSNWVNGTSNAGFTFQMPPYWASDPIDQTTEVIRTDKSDAVLLISYNPVNITNPGKFEINLTIDLEKEMENLKVSTIETIESDNNNVTASGTTLDGTIITAREVFDKDHIIRWICEYSNEDAVTKYSNTMFVIINSTQFN